MAQSKGSSAGVLVDFETAFKTAKSANKTGFIIPVISCDVKKSQGLNNSAEIRNDRNPTQPFLGNIEVAGNLVTAIRTDSIGWLLKALIGAPTTLERPNPDVDGATGSDIKKGAPTVTIAGDSGGYTFSADQDAAGDDVAVGDRVIYTKSGTRYMGYVTTKTNTTTGVLSTTRAGGTPCANVAGATINAICQNLADATPGTLAISSGVVTFSATHASLATGQLLVYLDDSDDIQYAKVTKTGAQTGTLKTLTGAVPADVTAGKVEWLGLWSYWTHTYKISPTASLPSFVLEKRFTDITPGHYELYAGCKINSMSLTISGNNNNELQATWAIIGADMDDDTSSYDANAVALAGTKCYHSEAAATEAGSPVSTLRELVMNINNDLDGDQFVISGGGVRGDLPEGIAQVGGTLQALFDGTSLLAKANGATESSLGLTFSPAGDAKASLAFSFPELIYAPNAPAISGPKGIVLDLNWGGYYDNGANASAAVVTLTNAIGAY